VRCPRHSWHHANPPACGDNARPVFGSADREGARTTGRLREQGQTRQPVSPPRHLLPKDLAGALKRLDDGEIDALLAAVTAEAERRGRLPPSPTKEKVPVNAKPQPGQAPAEGAPGSLTTGKLNAVRAAFKAGVKPSTIARQFGISQSDVRKALAAERQNR
jgi:hypothetical protein